MIIGEPASAGDSMILVRVSDGVAAASTAFALHVAEPAVAVDAIVALNPADEFEWDRIDLDIELLWNESRLDDPGRIDRPPVGIFSVERLPSGLRFTKKFGRIHGRIDRGTASAHAVSRHHHDGGGRHAVHRGPAVDGAYDAIKATHPSSTSRIAARPAAPLRSRRFAASFCGRKRAA